jgi:outer membrane protein OmpA-like peptidoglycan-associated protein
MVQADIAKKSGIVKYSSSEFTEDYSDRVGKSPLWITAKKVYGINRCDPIISYEDYLRIASVKKNTELLKNGKVVILLDKKNLEHQVEVPLKEKQYYIAYHQMKRYFFERKIPDTVLNDVLQGIQITVQNLKFIADSAELIPEEKTRIAQIAETLKKATSSGEYTIMIEGHTADVNKPNGQMKLSIERAQEIIRELTANGLDKNLFTYRGYGGTKPVASNETAEGRALNRRVEITVMPKGSYILRE